MDLALSGLGVDRAGEGTCGLNSSLAHAVVKHTQRTTRMIPVANPNEGVPNRLWTHATG